MKIYEDCDFFEDAQDEYSSPIEGGCESCYRYEICRSAKQNEDMKKDSQYELVPIKDFIDYNYENIAFDIRGVDHKLLLDKLRRDDVNHLYELERSNFIAIWNCDLQGFECDCDICFDGVAKTYIMAELIHQDGDWYYRIIDDAISNE